ncbi:protein translocase subunit SecF [Chitinimonas sp. BJB300]|uniref:protein translocase subunit SecF n=1 Tax=Chitinimonas sp. BJB300 TaxID=1559339 RepID=UPI000C0DDD03|nr:protein translocase subunit SecF [Chitinimonas sp. BJB300]PHV11617.1 protein translocase subunit SecF [Chitinimonas sp. BJB300]TSJ88245.1 protein translocase subunit SecF [Chitinimonas sp. BJB300]
MEMFHFKKDIPFMSYGKLTTTISLLTFLVAVFFLGYKGLNLSIEFTGGTVLEVRYSQPTDLLTVRHQVESLNLSGRNTEIVVQALGTSRDVMIRLPNVTGITSAALSEKVMAELRTGDPKVEQRKVEFVGPSVGEELVTHGLTALVIVCLGIIIYLAIRFEWRFAVSAIIANLHDVVIILGVFAFFQWEFSLTVLAAVLAVLGYSVNESVVVFDRIRENFRKAGLRGKTVPEVIDNAITATMSRTVITHGSTEMMVLAMLFFGGAALHGFAMALTIGIVFGIYSSVLVASPLLLLLGVTRENMIRPVKVKEEAVV